MFCVNPFVAFVPRKCVHFHAYVSSGRLGRVRFSVGRPGEKCVLQITPTHRFGCNNVLLIERAVDTDINYACGVKYAHDFRRRPTVHEFVTNSAFIAYSVYVV